MLLKFVSLRTKFFFPLEFERLFIGVSRTFIGSNFLGEGFDGTFLLLLDKFDLCTFLKSNILSTIFISFLEIGLFEKKALKYKNEIISNQSNVFYVFICNEENNIS